MRNRQKKIQFRLLKYKKCIRTFVFRHYKREDYTIFDVILKNQNFFLINVINTLIYENNNAQLLRFQFLIKI
jgi:hypothetical protein